jgi:hypothetical protein
LKNFFETTGHINSTVTKIDHKYIKQELNRLIRQNNFPTVGVIPKINLIIDFVGMPSNYNVSLLMSKRTGNESNVVNIDNIASLPDESKKSGGISINFNDVIDIFNAKNITIINGCLKLIGIPANFFVVNDLIIVSGNEPKIVFQQAVPDELKPIFENIKIIGDSEPKKESFENTNDNNYIFIIAIIIVLCFLLYNKK